LNERRKDRTKGKKGVRRIGRLIYPGKRKALQKEKCQKINFSFRSFPEKNEPNLRKGEFR